MVDRLSDMLESLKLRILSSFDARHAVQSSLISKSWVSLWTCTPILNFSSDGFTKPHDFDNFMLNALSRRQPVKLEKLTFKRGGSCDVKIIEKVFDYAFSHGVEELEANVVPAIGNHENWIWPIRSSNSLTSLKLQTRSQVICSFLEPRSLTELKNLTNLHLERVIITDLDPFSGFPALDKLRLLYCYLRTDQKALNVHALQLSEFTFFYHNQDVNRCELTTPKLRYFEWEGSGFPFVKAHLPVLDTVVINYKGLCRKSEVRTMFDNLLALFNAFDAAKSLTISAPVVHLLILFPMVNECSPFRDLKILKLDFSLHHLCSASSLSLSETLKLVPDVKDYLLHKSPDVKCSIINLPNVAKSPFPSSSHKKL